MLLIVFPVKFMYMLKESFLIYSRHTYSAHAQIVLVQCEYYKDAISWKKTNLWSNIRLELYHEKKREIIWYMSIECQIWKKSSQIFLPNRLLIWMDAKWGIGIRINYYIHLQVFFFYNLLFNNYIVRMYNSFVSKDQ